jgi:YNFM family putative membrane transporter
VLLGGVLLSVSFWVVAFVVGLGLFSLGFFGSLSVGSSWVGRRARTPQALASAIYLFFYYLGSSVIGSFSGVVWHDAGWPGVVALLGATLGISFVIALRLRGLVPLAPADLAPAT